MKKLIIIVLLLIPISTQSEQYYHLDRFKSWIGQTESNGANRSSLIDSMNRYVGNPLGSPYCAAAVCYSLRPSKFRTGLAIRLKVKESFTAWDVITDKRQIKKGYILIWQKGETIHGHAGLAKENWNGTRGKTYEGNTSSGNKGSQSNGDGFWSRNRAIQPTSYFRIKYITPI
jgi:hypothetical protein